MSEHDDDCHCKPCLGKAIDKVCGQRDAALAKLAAAEARTLDRNILLLIEERDELRDKLAAATYPTRDEGALAHRDSLEAKLAAAEDALLDEKEKDYFGGFLRVREERDELRDKLSEQIDRGNEAEADVRILRAKLAAAEKARDEFYDDAQKFRQREDAALARVRELEAQRSEMDCLYAGKYADTGGSHCPLDKPCDRCANEARVAALEVALRQLLECVGPGNVESDWRWENSAAVAHARRCLEPDGTVP